MSGTLFENVQKLSSQNKKLTGKPRIIKEYCNEEISVGMKDILSMTTSISLLS